MTAGVCAAGLIGLLVVGIAGTKLTVVVLAAGAFLALGYVTGNIRLICLYGFLITMSLNLSRKLTGFSDRGGGANAVQIDASDPFWLALAFFLAWELFARRRKTIRIPKVVWLWGLIMAMGTYTVLFGEFQRVAAYEVIRMAKVGTFFIVLANELRRPKQFIHAAAALAIGVLLQSCVAVLQYVKNDTLGLEILGETAKETTQQLAESSVVGQEIWRVSGLLLHPNLLGIYLAAIIPLMIAMFLAPINRSLRFMFLAATGLGTFALVVTFSRSSWVSFAGAMAVFGGLILAHRELYRRSLMPAIAAVSVVIVVLAVFSGKVLSRLFDSKIDATDARSRFKEEAARLIAEKPFFGWGMNSYVDEVLAFSYFSREAYGGWVPPVHNIYYLWTADTGLIGLSCYLLVIAFFVFVGIANIRTRDPMMFSINAACLAALVAFLIDGNFSFSLRVDQILRQFWIFGGIMVAIRYWRITGERSGLPLTPDNTDLIPDTRGLLNPRPSASRFSRSRHHR